MSFRARSLPYCRFRRVVSQRDENIMAERGEFARGGDSSLARRSPIHSLLPFIRNVPLISVGVSCHLRNEGTRGQSDNTRRENNGGSLGVNKDSGRRQGEGRARLCDNYGGATPDAKLAVGISSRYMDASVF